MKRRTFLFSASLAGMGPSIFLNRNFKNTSKMRTHIATENIKPLALTMWDFSWLERRWTGAGYEDWDKALSELVERGYNAVRIDAYPHLIANGKTKKWKLNPVWSVFDWGSPMTLDVQVQPALNEFIARCREHNVKVGLSSWYREDAENVRMGISSPEIMADQWIKTVESIDGEGLLDNIFYVDLCNEWPGSLWAPYFKNNPPELTWGGWYTTNSMTWMKKAVELFRKAYPELPAGISFEIKDLDVFKERDVSFADYLEPHIWMSQRNNNEFYRKMDFEDDTFSYKGFETMAAKGYTLYNSDKKYWQDLLTSYIQDLSVIARSLNQPCMTSECWAVVNYKDLPGLDWGWIKELCALGSITAADTGQWLAVSTSNFCGPQFTGMWRDIEWHQKLTNHIKSVNVNKDLGETKLARRIMK
jgi:hypothetical protein